MEDDSMIGSGCGTASGNTRCTLTGLCGQWRNMQAHIESMLKQLAFSEKVDGQRSCNLLVEKHTLRIMLHIKQLYEATIKCDRAVSNPPSFV